MHASTTSDGSSQPAADHPKSPRVQLNSISAGKPDRSSGLQATLWGLVALGVCVALLNLSWPIGRNALDYAKSSLDIIARHFNLIQAVHDGNWTGGKPILFATLAAPFVMLWGANTGIIMASVAGTMFYLWTTVLVLPRLLGYQRVSERFTPLALILSTCNPLVIYQFWSGYPDSLFAGFVILAFYLVDVVATEPQRDTRLHIVGLGVTILAALHTKFFGAVLLLLCPLYLTLRGHEWVTRGAHRRAKLTLLLGILFLVATDLALAKLSRNPLLIADPNAGFGDYLAGLREFSQPHLHDTLGMLVFSIVLVFHASLCFLLNPNAWRAVTIAPLAFAVIYLLALVPASGVAYNMRYFIPVFPFFAAAITAGAASMSTTLRRPLLAAYGTVATVLVLNFNVAPVEESLKPFMSKVFAGVPDTMGFLDNLRLPMHMALRQQIDAINREVPAGGTLYWSSDYYGTATHGLAHELGVRKDIEVLYVLEPTDPQPNPHSVYLTEFTSMDPPDKLWRGPRWATSKALGHGLFRLDPVRVEIISLSGDSVRAGDVVRVQARVFQGEGQRVGPAEFRDGTEVLAAESGRPWELELPHPESGRHEITARVSYGGQQIAISDPLVVFVGVPALERVARESSSLLVESRDKTVVAAQDVIWLEGSERAVGVRFEHISLVRKARIKRAYLTFTAASPEHGATAVDVSAELSPNASALRQEKGDLSGRPQTLNHIRWNLNPWIAAGQHDRSPNLGLAIQEVIDQTTWQPGNAILLLIHVSGTERLPRAADEEGHGAPTLYLEVEQ